MMPVSKQVLIVEDDPDLRLELEFFLLNPSGAAS